jgi:Cu-Zn family superoxide dismutase
MPRFRTTAIAALAASALLATSGAAYARDLHLKKVAREASEAPSMSWAYYRGDVTDLLPKADDVYDGARATAVMVGINGETTFRVTIRGLEKDAIGHDYGAHLHLGPCGLDSSGASTVGLHYNTDVLANKANPLVSDTTEVWLNFHVNSGGYAHATATVPFVPSGPVRSITFHELPTVSKKTEDGPAVGTAGTKQACIPLDIKKLTSSD